MLGLLLPALAGWPAAAAPLDDYQTTDLAWLRALDAKFFRSPKAFQDAQHFDYAAMAAGAELRAWQWTGDKHYLESALARLRLLGAAPDGAGAGLNNFFAIYPLDYCVDTLDRAGLMDPRLRAQIGARLNLMPLAELDQLHNRVMLRACGFALAARLWPDSPQASAWLDYAHTVRNRLLQLGGIPENAPGYDRTDLITLFLLEDALQDEEVLRNPGIASIYPRFRDQISPLGLIPFHGDSGAATVPFNEDAPFDSLQALDAAAFERAATFYHDPTLRWAAARVMAWTHDQVKFGANYDEMSDVFYLGFAHDWASPSMPAVAPALNSKILTRPDPANPAGQIPDKLILRGGAGSTAFLLVDLFQAGVHAHENQHGSIDYFEALGHPILAATGYNNRRPEDASLVLMTAKNESFAPGARPITPDTWYNASLPLSRSTDPSLSEISFAVKPGKAGVTFSLADLALDDGQQSVPIDAFTSEKNWIGPAPTETQEQGQKILQWNLPPNTKTATYVKLNNINLPLPATHRPLLEFRWKVSNSEEINRPLVVLIGPTVYHPYVRQLQPELTEDRVEDRGSAHFGKLSYNDWFKLGTRLERRIVLCDDGVLLVADKLVPDAAALGMQAGPIWQPVSEIITRRDPHSFFLGPPNRRYLALLNGDAPLQIDSETMDLWQKKEAVMFFGHAEVTAQPLRFVTAFVPEGTTPSDLHAVYAPDGVEITLSGPLARRITLKDSDAWDVQSGK